MGHGERDRDTLGTSSLPGAQVHAHVRPSSGAVSWVKRKDLPSGLNLAGAKGREAKRCWDWERKLPLGLRQIWTQWPRQAVACSKGVRKLGIRHLAGD